MSLHDVSNILWRQRHLLEMLLFKLEEEQLVLAAGRTRWLPHATREVEAVLDEIRDTELLRAATVEALVPVLGLSSNPSLRELAEAAPEPWNDLFEDHRREYLKLTDEISAASTANAELLTRGANAVREVLGTFDRERPEPFPTSYGPGSTRTAAARSFLLDEAL